MRAAEFVQPDFAAAIRLLRECGLPHADLSETSAVHFLASGRPDAPAGVIGLEPLGAHGLLRSLAVAPAHRRQGLGRILVEGIEGHARSIEIRHLFLLTTDAATYFETLGFSKVGREDAPAPIRATPQFSALCPASAVMMSKPL